MNFFLKTENGGGAIHAQTYRRKLPKFRHTHQTWYIVLIV